MAKEFLALVSSSSTSNPSNAAGVLDEKIPKDSHKKTSTFTSGGCRGWGKNSSNDLRSTSNIVFRKHRIEEVQRYIEDLNLHVLNANQKSAVLSSAAAFSRFYPFLSHVKDVKKQTGDIGTLKIAQSRNHGKILLKIRKERFGWQKLIKVTKKLLEKSGNLESVREFKNKEQMTYIPSPLYFCLNSDGYLMTTEAVEGREIMLEIGAGDGEWAVKQASATKDHAFWLVNEYRADRAYRTAVRSIFSSIKNMAVLAGDARKILDAHIRPNSIKHVFVNHPEPPQQRHSGGRLTTQATHLYTRAFLRRIYNVLEPTGELTIVTDNEWYGKMLLQSVASITRGRRKDHLFSPISLSESEGRIADQNGKFSLWVREPGNWCGHVAASSSYFDRMFKKNQKTDRYILHVGKVNKSPR
mmetsp:Transcript_2424/g.3483  ORF Transcript_2424/g.3483 Transcript_2424/m.3483 type:complete len:412 (-) Transcript_2424:43-1278(-)